MRRVEGNGVEVEPRRVVRRGLRDALAAPSLVLLFSMMGFGSVAASNGLSLPMALVTTAGVWGLPGQLAMVELYAAGASAAAAIAAASFANARFLPMSVSFLPLMREGVRRRDLLLVLVQLLSINSWAVGQRVFPVIAPRLRWLWFLAFAGTCMAAGLAGTALGFYGLDTLPRPVSLGLVFLNPLFFAVLLSGTTGRPAVMALLLGALLGPPMHLVSPDWGLLATGLLAGTGAFWLSRPVRPA